MLSLLEALVLTPESLPYLSECMHDDDQAVEAACHGLMAFLETATGEDLQSYLA